MTTTKAKTATAKSNGFDKSKIKRKKVVSLPTLSISKHGDTVYVKFAGPITQRVINEGKENERTFQFAEVVNHETGELMNLNVDNGLKWALEGAYDNDDYNGLSFEIIGHKEQGRRFMKFAVQEIEV